MPGACFPVSCTNYKVTLCDLGDAEQASPPWGPRTASTRIPAPSSNVFWKFGVSKPPLKFGLQLVLLLFWAEGSERIQSRAAAIV